MRVGESTIQSVLAELEDRFANFQAIGTGGSAKVYKAFEKARDRWVAIKFLVNPDAFGEHGAIRFREEHKICKSVRHPNLIESYDLFEFRNMLGYSMEYVEGKDLSHLIYAKPSAEEIERIFIAVLSGLEKLHSEGMVHRDIKLENVLIRHDGAVKISDFGLVKNLYAEGLTGKMMAVGTAQYLPPEYLLDGSPFDKRGDIYSCGMMLWEIVNGERRYIELSADEVVMEIIRNKRESPKIKPGVNPKFAAIIQKACAQDPEKRFQSVREMAEAFRSGEMKPLERDGVSLQPSFRISAAIRRATPKSSSPLLLLAAGIGIGILMVLMVLFVRTP